MTTTQILKNTRTGRDGRTLTCRIDNGDFVMAGGEWGEHRLAIAHTSDARLAAHWDGYCRENGWRPKLDTLVDRKMPNGETMTFLAVGGDWAKHLKGRY